MSFDSDLKTVQSAFRTAFKSSGMTSGELESLRIQFLGRKGEIASLFRKMGQVSDEEKPLLGNEFSTISTYSLLCVVFKNSLSKVTGFFQIKFFLNFFKFFITTETLSALSG